MNDRMKEAVDFLYGMRKFTSKHPLEHTSRLMTMIGDPAAGRKVIHVAGSNGKGSVCNYIYTVLRNCGKNAGLFTSPHLVDVRERFKVNGELISEETFVDAYDRVFSAAKQLEDEGEGFPTFFEFIYAMGMLIFEEADVEYIVLETGLGGRLDCTNTFAHPILSIITSISLEHTEYLGDTIEQIAMEKAGIIKAGVPVIYDASNEAANRVIEATVTSIGTKSCAVAPNMYNIKEFKNNYIDFYFCGKYDEIEEKCASEWSIRTNALYQMANASIAISALRELNLIVGNNDFSDEVIRAGIAQAKWPGRMDEVKPDVFLDGAHNPSGISMFVESVKNMTEHDEYPPMLLFSMVKDKDYETSSQLLLDAVKWESVSVAPTPGSRGMAESDLKALFEKKTDLVIDSFGDAATAFNTCCERKKEGQKLFCTGSLYFVGALLEII